MGIEVKPECIEYGDDCPSCSLWFPLNWPPGKTPKYIYAYFAGLIACADYNLGFINDHAFKMIQDTFQPCWWVYDGPDWLVTFYADAGATRSTIGARNKWYERVAFYGDLLRCRPEHTVFPNLCSCADPTVMAYSGFCEVFWLARVHEHLEYLVPDEQGKLLYEPRISSSSITIDKLCKRKDHTNLKIKFET